MSDKNETEKSNVSKKSSLFEKLKSKYIRKWIYSFILPREFYKIAHGFLKYKRGLSPLQLEINNKNRIDQLSDFRNWYYYLKYIYSALSEVAKKIYDNAYQKLKDPDRNKLDKYKKHAIEAVIYMCLFDIVYLTENKKIFNANDLKIQKDKSSKDEYLDKVSLETTVFNIIQKAINQSLNSATSNLKNSVDKLFKEVLQVEKFCSWCNYYEVVADYFSKKFPNYKFRNDLCCLITKILWLKSNNFYKESISNYDPKCFTGIVNTVEDFNYMILDSLELPSTCFPELDLMDGSDFSYQYFIKSLQINDDLYLIVCNNRDFDIRAYCSYGLYDEIRKALTKEQEVEFKQFLESKIEPEKDSTTEKSMPDCKPKDSQNISVNK